MNSIQLTRIYVTRSINLGALAFEARFSNITGRLHFGKYGRMRGFLHIMFVIVISTRRGLTNILNFPANAL